MDSLLEPSLLLLTFLLCLLAVSGIANASLFHRLRQIRQRTEKKLAVKTATLAMLSHEIRNPLAGLVHVARALGCTPLDATQRELLETLDDSGNALLTLLDNTLQHTRLDADAFISQTGDFSLASLVKRLMALFEPQAANKGLLLTSSIDCSLPAILHGDSGSLRQILSNLLGNAIKFTDSGIVKLQVERDNSTAHPYLVIFRVIDSGIGIPPALHEKVFNPFSQGLPSIQQQFGGAGLGLSISRQLARAIGGNIELHSEEGRGSTFTLTLPLQGQTLPTCQLYTLPEPARPARQPLRLLVVDDTEIHRIAMRSLLEAEGHSVTLTDTTDAALQYARNDHFDGILLDVHMPGMDSISAIRQLRATGNTCGIIALSAWLDDHDIHRLLDAGVDAVCYKPLDPAIVHRALAGITQNIRSAGKIPGNGLSRRHGSRIS